MIFPSDPPNPDQLEITLFGPGFGESILVHIGNNHWFIIDSCVDRTTNNPAPLSYLDSIGKDPAESIDLIIASHWHDDHIRGLAEIFKRSKKAEFCAAGAMQKEEFMAVVTRAEEDNSLVKVRSGVREIRKIYEILDTDTSRAQPKVGTADRLLRTFNGIDCNLKNDCEIYSLSPSDKQINNFYLNLASMIPKIGETRGSIPSPAINDLSVVVLVKIGDFSMLFGSDLQETSDPEMGWSIIVSSTGKPNVQSSIFKIPHHGSENAHQSLVWEKMLLDNPLSILTPFNRGKQKLPRYSDIQRINSLTHSAFLASKNKIPKGKQYPKPVQKTIDEKGSKVRSLEEMGMLRLRNSGSSKFEFWGVECFGTAHQI